MRAVVGHNERKQVELSHAIGIFLINDVFSILYFSLKKKKKLHLFQLKLIEIRHWVGSNTVGTVSIRSIADFIGIPYFSRFLSGLKSHALISHDFLSQSKFVPLPRGRAAMCSRPASKY